MPFILILNSVVRIRPRSVETLEKTVEFCRKHIYTFEPVLEILDEEYHLRLGVKYR